VYWCVILDYLLGVCPASEAADISEYLGSPVLSAGLGEQEQSKRARRRRGIRLF